MDDIAIDNRLCGVNLVRYRRGEIAERRLSANAAARVGEGMAFEPRPIDALAGVKMDDNGFAGSLERGDTPDAIDNAFGIEKPCHQFAVMSWCSHCDGDRTRNVIDGDRYLQRFLDGEGVIAFLNAIRGDGYYAKLIHYAMR